MRNGQQLENAAVLNAEILMTRKVTGAYGSVQGTLYRLPEGGCAVQIVHRLPAGCCRHERPVFFTGQDAAAQSLAFALAT